MPSGVYGAALEYAQRAYGGFLREEEATVSVATSRTEVAPRDPERVVLTFTNLGTGTMTVAPSPSVSASRGIQLTPGTTVSFNVAEDGNLCACEWHAVDTVGAQTLYRVTVRRDTAQG